jgi:hypothetical protein
MRLWHRSFFVNPVLDYLNRRSWRRYRRWGWTLILAPAAIVCVLLFLNSLYLSFESDWTGRAPMMIGVALGGLSVWGLALLPLVFCFGGITRLLGPQNVEQLLLTQIEPAQIWVAVLVNLNRNLLVLLSATVPLLTALSVAATFPVWFIPAQALVLIAYINLLALGFVFIALETGLRWFPAKGIALGGAFLIVQLIIFVFCAEEERISLAAVFIPAFFWISGLASCVPELGPLPEMSGWLWGLELPVWPGIFGAMAFTAAALGWSILAGPLNLPPMPPATGKNAGGRPKGFAERLLERPYPRIFRSSPYPWSDVISRLYENSPGFILRHPYLARSIRANALWVILVSMALSMASMAITDESFDLPATLPLLVVGMLAGFHFAFAGDPKAPGPRMMKARSLNYAFKMGIVLFAFWAIAHAKTRDYSGGDLDRLLGANWFFWPLLSKHLGFIVLALASQLAFQLWVSLGSVNARAAAVAGIAHIVAVWLAPLALLLPLHFLPRGAFALTEIMSLFPAIGFAASLRDATADSALRYMFGYGGLDFVAAWELSAMALFAELLIFGALLTTRAVRRAIR